MWTQMVELPLYQTVPVPLYAAMVGYYHLLAPRFHTEKQRAYILSTLSASVMSAASIPFVWLYLTRGMGGVFEAGQDGWLGVLAQLGVMFFGVYLFENLVMMPAWDTDKQLTLGFVKYPSQIGLLTGWVHHTIYDGLMVYCLSTRQSPVFLTCALMELPTLDLALSNLFPSIRNDLRFLSSFFLIRIVYNAVLLVDCLRPSSRAAMDSSWVPAGTLFMAGALHVSWFQGGLKGYLKRQHNHSAIQHIAVKAEGGPSLVVVDNDKTVPSAPIPASTPSTPDDSPLITPRTPSITPMSLRDTYLPTLAIPSIPNLPTLHMPALPHLNVPDRFLGINGDINFGFKDAVKSRWDDRRAALGGMGLNLNLNMGGLGRRRATKVEDEQKVVDVWVQEVQVDEHEL